MLAQSSIEQKYLIPWFINDNKAPYKIVELIFAILYSFILRSFITFAIYDYSILILLLL